MVVDEFARACRKAFLLGFEKLFDGRERALADIGAGHAADASELAHFPGSDKGDRGSALAGASGPPDAVDIGLHALGNGVVDDVREVVDVDSARGDVGRDEQAELAGFEVVDDARALRLRDVSVQGVDGISAGGECIGEFIDVAAGFAENHGVKVVFHIDDTGEYFEFVFAADLVVDLFGEIGADGFGFCTDDFVVGAHELFRDGENFLRHGCGEHEHALFGRRRGENPLDVVDESHVEHFVGFVENGELDFIEDEFFAFHEVDDASGRADDDVDSLIQFFELNADELSSVEGGDAEIGVPLQGIEFFRDLNGEFPGRGENEGFGVSVAAADGVDDRNAERRCFACSGLSLPDDVSFSFEEEWDR